MIRELWLWSYGWVGGPGDVGLKGTGNLFDDKGGGITSVEKGLGNGGGGCQGGCRYATLGWLKKSR